MDVNSLDRVTAHAPTPTSPAVFPPIGPSDTRQHAHDDALNQTHAGQPAYMQSLPPESLVRDVDISVSPNKTEARAYTHSPQPRQKPADLPSILQIPQAAQQEPSTVSFATSSATLPLVGPSSARCEDIAEEKSLAQVPTAISSSAGPLTSSALHELLLELEMESVAHRDTASAALTDDHSGEAPFVMKLPRSGLTTWKTSLSSRIRDVDGIPPTKPFVKDASPQVGPESRMKYSAASDIGSPIQAHRPVPIQVLTSPCEAAALPSTELGFLPHDGLEHSPAVYAGLPAGVATDAPTFVPASVLQGPTTPDVSAPSGPCNPDGGGEKKHDVLPDAVDEGQVGSRVISPEGIPLASTPEDVAPLAEVQNMAHISMDQEHLSESAVESAVIPFVVLDPMPPGDVLLVCSEMPSEQSAPETVTYQPSHTLDIGDVATSSLDTETRLALPSLEHAPSTTSPAAEEDMAEGGLDEAAMPISSTPVDQTSAPATSAEADRVRDMDTCCGHPSSQAVIIDYVANFDLQVAIPVDLVTDSPADSGIPCSAAPTPSDVPMDCDKLSPPAYDESQPRGIPPMTIACDAAAVPLHPHPPASALSETEITGVPFNASAGEDSKLPLSLDSVAEDPAPMQEVGEDVPGSDDVLALSTRPEEAAVDSIILCGDLQQPGNAISDASGTSGLGITLDIYTDVLIPLDDVVSIPSHPDIQLPESVAHSDEIANIAHAGDVHTPEDITATACPPSELADVSRPEPPSTQFPEDSQPTVAPVHTPIAHPTVCSPTETVPLPSSQADLDADSVLDVDLTDYYAALPDFGDGTSGEDDFHSAMPMSDDPADDIALPEFDLPPSSPPPSSSPPRVFSSPGPASLETTPSSSPPLGVGDRSVLSLSPKGDLSGSSSRPPKRTLEEEDIFTTPSTSHLPRLRERQSKRTKTEDIPPVHTPPNPIRPTPASQAKQRKKLAAPFRSPIIKGPLVQGGLHAVYATGRAAIPLPPRKVRIEEDNKGSSSALALLKPEVPVANKDRTANVAKQFKSPLQAGAASCSGVVSTPVAGTFSSVKAAPTIQALQGKVQTLKQAIKIKNSRSGEDEDELLEGLVEKWTTAAREIAWAVWDYVKDLDPGSAPDVGTKGGWFADDESAVPGTKRGFDASWGYDDEHVEKRARMAEGGEEKGRRDEDEEEEEPQVVQHTLGVMLRRMGIDPATLGWDEEEGDFVDVDA